MATEVQVSTPDVFQIIESYDEKQILDIADFRDNKSLTYEVNGKKEISYLGIKHLSLIMAQNGNPLEPVDSKLDLFGEGPEKIWYSSVKIKNKSTGQMTEGVSQCSYYDTKGKLDSFARVKAHSKAERNAIRKQIPEGMITKLINEVQNPTTKPKDNVIKQSSSNLCSCLVPKPNPTDNHQCTTCKKNITSSSS